jgi:hypothetical protein
MANATDHDVLDTCAPLEIGRIISDPSFLDEY